MAEAQAELIAMSSTANELMWAKPLCTDLSLTAQKPTLWGDSKSANLLVVNPISSDRSKHIRVRHLRVREYVELDEMTVKWIGTGYGLMHGRLTICLSMLSHGRNIFFVYIFWDPPSICGDSDLSCLNDCV